MSIVMCDNCGTDIDTDWDVDCWCVQKRNNLAALCKFCRETTDDDIRWATETGQMQ